MVTIKQVLKYKFDAQHGQCLRETREFISDLQQMVRSLEIGHVPILSFNINSVQHVLQSHARLRQLQEDLEDCEKCEEP